ncbi:MAG: serine hydrolase domain-containing protein [bacterium]
MKVSISKKHRLVFILFFLVSVPGLLCGASIHESLPAHTESRAMDPGLAESIESYSLEAMEELESPGLIVGIVDGNTLVFAGYYGYAEIESGRKVGKDTFFRIGSISKSVSTIGLLQQWEKDRFELDEDINDYLPEPMIHPPHPETKPVTFRHLLTHTSGGGEFLSYEQLFHPNLGMQVEGYDYKPLEYYLRFGMETRVDPGLTYAYCNYGFGFLGLALENMADTPFNEYMIENVFEPLGMDESTYHHDPAMMKRMAVGYRVGSDGEYEATEHRAGGMTPAGNVYTTLEEFGLYVKALLNKGRNSHGRVIEPDTLEKMMKTHHSWDKRMRGYGFGLRIYGEDIWGHRVVGHSGSVPFGYTAQMLLVPDERVGVMVCSNSMTYSPKEIAWGVLKRYLGIKEPAFHPADPNTEVWPELTGFYGPRFHHLKLNFRLYMGGTGHYRVDTMDGRLVLIKTWQGRDQARRLFQVDPDDPYFYRLERKEDKEAPPRYVSFQKEGGEMYLVPGGYNRYVKLGPLRTVRALFLTPGGRLITEINPF